MDCLTLTRSKENNTTLAVLIEINAIYESYTKIYHEKGKHLLCTDWDQRTLETPVCNNKNNPDKFLILAATEAPQDDKLIGFILFRGLC